MSPLRDASDLGCAADLWPSATFLPVTLQAAWAEVLSDAASAVAAGSGKSPVAGPSVEAKVEVEMLMVWDGWGYGLVAAPWNQQTYMIQRLKKIRFCFEMASRQMLCLFCGKVC